MTSRTQNKRVWLAGGVVLAVVIIAAAWATVIGPQLSSAKTLRGEADAGRAQNSLLEAKVAKLKLQNDNVGTLTTSLHAALAALPFDSGLPAFTRQLSSQATQNKVTLSSITVGSIAAATATAPTTATTTTGIAAAPAAALVAIPITLATSGSAKDQLAFLKAIQVTGPRRALVSSTQLAPGAGGSNASIDAVCTMTTQLNVFSAPLTTSARTQLEKLLRTKFSK